MRAAFSLIELSIVLVILGLLTGGILTGQNLIRAAELRSVITEFKTYQTSVMTFRDKYFAIPGDMRNATDFWEAMTNCGAASPSGTDTETCNGDGDGTIENAGSPEETGESFGFWQQLANAGLVEGSYTGIAGAGNVMTAVPATNTPRSKMSNGTWLPRYLEPAWSGNTVEFNVLHLNFFVFGAARTNDWPNGGILQPEEAWNIDTKIDDGKPGRGRVISSGWDNVCANATSKDDLDADYLLSNKEVVCTLRFVRLF
jgi:prepilin-type N-terminal cleavage/methylation domain-containing protein